MSERAPAASAGDSPVAPRHSRPPRIIAVDGSAASGKSTVGRLLASRLGYRFLDTGIMYRAITWAAIQEGIDVHAPAALTELAGRLNIQVELPEPGSHHAAHILVEGEDVTPELRRPEVDENVSFVSRVKGVREALVRRQKELAAEGRIVMAGRDIGTVVLPHADVKIYLDASPEERARRRHRDFEESGQPLSEDAVLQDLTRRDQIDSERAVSPLKPADDATIIDTDGMSREEVLAEVIRIVEGGA